MFWIGLGYIVIVAIVLATIYRRIPEDI